MGWLRWYFRGYYKLLALSLFLATVNQVFSLLDPQIFRLIVDEYATNIDKYTTSSFVHGVGLLLLGMMAVAMISRIAKNFQDYFVSIMMKKIGMNVYQDSLNHALSLPYSAFEDQQSGQILGKIQKVRDDIQAFLSDMINIMFLSLVGLLFVIVYAFTVEWVIAVYFIALIPLMGFTMIWMSRRIKKAQEIIVRESTTLAGATTETMRNVSIVKSLGLQHQEMLRLETANVAILALEMKKIIMLRHIQFWQGTMISTMRILLMGTMFRFVYKGVVTMGEFFSLFFYSFFVFWPLANSGSLISSYQQARASHGVLQDIMAMKPEELPTHPVTIKNIDSMEFKNVNFSYQSGKPVLHDVSFELTKGETIAFVWPSGAGKSTIMKLLTGLYRPTKGKVLVNDIPLHTADMEALRRQFGLVAQDAQLFAGTIRDNLLFVKPHATDEECLQVLKDAQILGIVEDSPEGLHTKIGEGGLKLSGGQKQRLAIARALLREPSVLLFDEATSSLDSIVEEEINKTIQKISEKRPEVMMVVVAHRLSTVAHADKIFVLEKGHVVQTGTHKELVKDTAGLYYAMRRQQIAMDDDAA